MHTRFVVLAALFAFAAPPAFADVPATAPNLGTIEKFGNAVSAPANFTFSANPAACKSAQFSPEDLQAHPDLESLCEYELKTNQDVLATWTWSRTPCGVQVCDDSVGFLPYSGGTPFYVPFKPDARAELFYLSDLQTRRCVTLRTIANSLQSPVMSADSNAACLPLQLTPVGLPHALYPAAVPAASSTPR